MNTIMKLTQFELIKYLRQPLTVGFGIIFPTAWILMNGLMFKNEPSEILGGLGTVDFMFPGFIFLIILVSGLSSLPLTIAKNYETKAIVRYSLTPIKRSQYIFSIFLGGFFVVMFSTIIMFIVGKITYDIAVPSLLNLLLMFPTIFLITIGVSSFGIILASIIKGFQSTLSISLLIYFLLLFITGCSVPLPVLPEVFSKISQYIPFSHMVLLLQNIWLETTDGLILHIAVSIVTTIILFLLAAYTFKWNKKS